MKRISFDQLGILISLAAACRGEDYNTVVGGAAFDDRNRILAVSYNGYAPKMHLPKEFLENRELKNSLVIHCETNLLAQLKIGEANTIYLNYAPCYSCAKNIAAHKVKRVMFLKEYHRDQQYKDIFQFYSIDYEKMNKETLKEGLRAFHEISAKFLE